MVLTHVTSRTHRASSEMPLPNGQEPHHATLPAKLPQSRGPRRICAVAVSSAFRVRKSRSTDRMIRTKSPGWFRLRAAPPVMACQRLRSQLLSHPPASSHERGCGKLILYGWTWRCVFAPRGGLGGVFLPREVDLAVCFLVVRNSINVTQVIDQERDISCSCVAAVVRQILVSKRSVNKREGLLFSL